MNNLFTHFNIKYPALLNYLMDMHRIWSDIHVLQAIWRNYWTHNIENWSKHLSSPCNRLWSSPCFLQFVKMLLLKWLSKATQTAANRLPGASDLLPLRKWRRLVATTITPPAAVWISLTEPSLDSKWHCDSPPRPPLLIARILLCWQACGRVIR